MKQHVQTYELNVPEGPQRKLKCDQAMPNFISSPIISMIIKQNRNNHKSSPMTWKRRIQMRSRNSITSSTTSIIIRKNRNNHTTKHLFSRVTLVTFQHLNSCLSTQMIPLHQLMIQLQMDNLYSLM